MLRRSALAGLAVLIVLSFAGATDTGSSTTGYLQVIYKSCECGMDLPHVFSCYAPFSVQGKKIVGDFEISEDEKVYLPPLPLVPADREAEDFRKQFINYSYECPPADDSCPPTKVEGQLLVHKVSGEVLNIKGKKMLHFVVRLSIPTCTVNVCGQSMDRPMEPWDDEFLAPYQDGYRTERGDNALLSYVVNLQADH
jgi:hypothetical protein